MTVRTGILGFLALAALIGCWRDADSRKTTARYDTPHAVCETWLAAMDQGDFHTAVSCLAPESAPEKRRLLKIPEVMEELTVSRSTVYALMGKGELAWVRIGRTRRVPAEAVEALITKNTVVAPLTTTNRRRQGERWHKRAARKKARHRSRPPKK
jgi:excisionase family DNA binding protein